ncbi:MAG: DUF2924 domain-containing protein [Planctomycetes bacterium]|nr:DUF2924 domain-containing protein [Planctomycetota bacterium]
MTSKQTNLSKELQDLEAMSVSELRARYAEVFGGPTRSRNKPYLKKRVAWQLQANAEGGLSERAKARAAELAKNQELRVRMPGRGKARAGAEAAAEAQARTVVRPFRGAHDPRIPMPGTVLTREYQGKPVRVTVLEQGFDYEGRVYRSLSAIAREVAGCAWNGYAFFGLGARS